MVDIYKKSHPCDRIPFLPFLCDDGVFCHVILQQVQKHSFIGFVLLSFAFNLNAINYEKANGIK